MNHAMRWNVRRLFEAFIPTVGTEDTVRVRFWNEIITQSFRWHGCRGARVLGFKDEERVDNASEEGGFTTRVNASEVMHSSYVTIVLG
jgi:hypothetical protein